MRSLTIALSGIVLIAATACDVSEQTAQSTPSRSEIISDSAGIRIGEHELGALDDDRVITWVVDPVAELRIGGVGDPAKELTRVTGAVRYDDGRLVIGIGGGPELRVYSAKGEIVRTIGRQGTGPGEFRFLAGPWYVDAGRFQVYDQRQRRLSLFDTAGALLSSSTVSHKRPKAGTTVFTSVIDGTPNGEALVMGQHTSVLPMGLSRAPVTFAYLDTAGMIKPVAGPYPGPEMFVGQPGPGGGGALLRPLFPLTTLAAACGDLVAIADNAKYDIRIVDSSGEVKTIIRSDLTGELASEDDFRTFLKMHSPPRLRITDEMVKSARDVSPMTRLPVLHSLSCDADGNLWVEEFARPAAARRRVASYSMDGHRRGAVMLPARDSLLFVRGERIVLETKGENDAELIEVRRILNALRR